MEFRTIKEDGQVQEEIKKSRFICHAKRVYSEEEARGFITAIKKEHYKATVSYTHLDVYKRQANMASAALLITTVS